MIGGMTTGKSCSGLKIEEQHQGIQSQLNNLKLKHSDYHFYVGKEEMHQFGVREEMHSQLQNKFMNMNWVSLEKRNPRYTDENWDASFMNPDTVFVGNDGKKYLLDEDGLKIAFDDSNNQRLQSIVSRYLKNAKRYLANVSSGTFP
jgi:hypothetical protein